MKFAPIVCELRQQITAVPVHYIAPPTPADSIADYPMITLVPGPLEFEPTAEISGLSGIYSRVFYVGIEAVATEADEFLESLIDRVHNAMIGFRPYRNGNAIAYRGGVMESIDGHLVRWLDEFELRYNRTYTLRPADPSGLPELTPDL